MNSRVILVLFGALTFLYGCATPNPIDSATSAPPGAVLEDSSPAGNATTANRGNVYLLEQGDSIAIQVFDEPDLTLDTVVGASGSINYSYLGDIRVAGKSPAELEQHIASLLKDGYLVNPSVNVTVLEYRPFYMNGEVRSPGSYPYEPGLTVDRAIALAGGLTERASTRKIFVSSEEDSSSNEAKASLNYRVQPGDTITIKEGFF